MEPLLGALGFVVFIIGIGLLIRPVAQIKVSTRGRAAAVAGAGLTLFITALAITPPPDASASLAGTPLPEQASDKQVGVPATGVTAEIAKPIITEERIGQLVAAHPVIQSILQSMAGKMETAISEDHQGWLEIAVVLTKRTDGRFAPAIARELTEAVIKELVATGANPRTQHRIVRVVVDSPDAPDSITGAKQVAYFGRAVYQPGMDKVEWHPAD